MKNLFIVICLVLLILPSRALAAGTKIAILPWKINSAENVDYVKDAMADMLSSRIGAGASVEVLRSDVVRDAAQAERRSGEINEASAVNIGKKLKADYVLFGSLTVFGAAVSLDAKFLNTSTGAVTPFFARGVGMDSVIGMTDKLSAEVLNTLSGVPAQKTVSMPSPAATPAQTPAKEAAPQVESGFIVKAKETDSKKTHWKSRSLDGELIAMIAADLDRDGKKELFLLKRTGVIVARIVDGKLDVIKELPSDGIDQNIAITAFDAENGPAVYVSALRKGEPAGYVIEYKDNAYKTTLTGIKWAMRAIRAGDKTVLVGQKFKRGDGFRGALRVLKKQGNEIIDAGPFEAVSPGLPNKINLYTFELIKTEKDAFIAGLDDRGYVRLYRKDARGKWEMFYKSAEYYGGTLNMVGAVDEDRAASNEQDFNLIEGRFFVDDLDRDSKPELVIKRNVPGGLGRFAKVAHSFTSGTVVDLSLEDIADPEKGTGLLAENWRTKDINGYIADFFIAEPASDGSKEIYMLVVEGTGAFAGNIKSYILLNKLAL